MVTAPPISDRVGARAPGAIGRTAPPPKHCDDETTPSLLARGRRRRVAPAGAPLASSRGSGELIARSAGGRGGPCGRRRAARRCAPRRQPWSRRARGPSCVLLSTTRNLLGTEVILLLSVRQNAS